MLLCSWLTQAARPCSLSLKSLSLIILSLNLMMLVKVLKVNLFYATPSKGITNQSVCLPVNILQENVLSYKLFLAVLNPNSHFFGSSVPGCSSSCPQGSAAGIPALRNSSWASGRAVLSSVTLPASLPTLSASSLELPWQEPEGLVWKGFFTRCFQLSSNMGLSPTNP